MIVFPVQIAGHCHAQRCGKRCGRMSRFPAVMLALMALLKAGQSLVLPQRRELPRPPGEDLMDIALVSDIKQDAVARRIKDDMQRKRKLYDAQIAGKVAARPGDRLDEKGTDLSGQRLQFLD